MQNWRKNMQIMIDSWIFNFPIKIASSFTERIFYTLAIYIQEIFKLIVVSERERERR